MVTSVKDWKNKKQTGSMELQLPSGNTCLVQRLKPEAFLNSGLIPDSLTAMINVAIKSKRGLPPDALKQIVADPKKIRQSMQMMDEVACYVLIEPHLVMPPKCAYEMAGNRICGEYFDTEDKRHQNDQHPDWHGFAEGERNPEVLYADEVSEEDKQFIFSFAVGGTADVETFRQELSSSMADISNGKNVRRKAKRPARRK